MTSSVIAIQKMDELKDVEDKKSKEKLVILAFMAGSKSSETYQEQSKKMKPILDQIAKEKNDACFYTIDVDKAEFKDYAQGKKFRALPALEMMKDAKTVKRLVNPGKVELTDSIEAALNVKTN